MGKAIRAIPRRIPKAYRRVKRASEILLREPEPQVGLTPKEVIWTKNKRSFIATFQNKKNTKSSNLLIYALINKPYIMDLTPGNSLVEY